MIDIDRFESYAPFLAYLLAFVGMIFVAAAAGIYLSVLFVGDAAGCSLSYGLQPTECQRQLQALSQIMNTLVVGGVITMVSGFAGVRYLPDPSPHE